jgi:hypothetical protein
MRTFVLLPLFVLVPLLACFMQPEDDSNASDTEYIPDDVPSGNCGETDNEPCTSSGAEAPSDCQASIECGAGTVCAAGFDGDIGMFQCRASCIDDFDETRWCIDDAGCCGPGSICQGRGYCVPAGTTSSETGDTSTSDTSTSDTSTSDASTSESSSTSGGALAPEIRPIPR